MVEVTLLKVYYRIEISRKYVNLEYLFTEFITVTPDTYPKYEKFCKIHFFLLFNLRSSKLYLVDVKVNSVEVNEYLVNYLVSSCKVKFTTKVSPLHLSSL